jgi:hypothetical protein
MSLATTPSRHDLILSQGRCAVASLREIEIAKMPLATTPSRHDLILSQGRCAVASLREIEIAKMPLATTCILSQSLCGTLCVHCGLCV